GCRRPRPRHGATASFSSSRGSGQRGFVEIVMKVHRDLICVQEHHGIRGWFMTLGYGRNRMQVERHLMIESAHGRIRNAAPTAAYRPVDVAEEQVAQVIASGG